MFGLDGIGNFDFSEWLMTSVFSIHNPFAVYLWLVIAVISLFKGKRRSIFTAFFELRKINSSAFKPLEKYMVFEISRMIIPGFVAMLLRLAIGESSHYEWSFTQLVVVLPSIALWILYNIIDIKISNNTIETARNRLAPTLTVRAKPRIKPASIVSGIFSSIVQIRTQTEKVKNIDPGEKSEPYEMNIEKMRVSSDYDSADGIKIESKSIDNEAVIHNSKELAKKAQSIAGNLLVDGKRVAIVAAGKTAKSFDDKLSNQMKSTFEIESKMKRMFVLDLLNSLGPLILIYAILPFTFCCSIIPRSILSSLKIFDMFSQIRKGVISSEGSGSIVKGFCKQELALILLSIISLVSFSQLIQFNPEYFSELSDGIKILSILVFGSWCLCEIILTLKLYQKLDAITNPQNALISLAEKSVAPAIKMALKVQGGPKKAVIRIAKRGAIALTQKKLSEKEDTKPSTASKVALKVVNVAENILTLPEKLIDKGMEASNKYLESKPKSLGTYPERSVKTTLLLICWSILPVAYIVLLSYAL